MAYSSYCKFNFFNLDFLYIILWFIFIISTFIIALLTFNDIYWFVDWNIINDLNISYFWNPFRILLTPHWWWNSFLRGQVLKGATVLLDLLLVLLFLLLLRSELALGLMWNFQAFIFIKNSNCNIYLYIWCRWLFHKHFYLRYLF